MDVNELLSHFDLQGDIINIEPHGNGHINKTFLVETDQCRYIFQFINSSVFPDVAMLMNNIAHVTEHLRAKGIPTLEIIKAKDGRLYLDCGDAFFRGYRFIENSICYEKLPSLDMVAKAAGGFGTFHHGLADIDVSQIGDVIPHFHDTDLRFLDFKKAVEENRSGRASSCQEEMDFLLSRESDYALLTGPLHRGEIRKAVTHNDPKINNVAFDKTTGEVACILDLDTVMTGTFLYDVGDGLRSLFTGDNEDNVDTSLLKVDFDIYKTYIEGYYGMAKETMNQKEIDLLPYSVLVIAEELAMRFLGDYINGDIYFGVAYPTHNLVRARTQIALAKDLFLHMDELTQITHEIVAKSR